MDVLVFIVMIIALGLSIVYFVERWDANAYLGVVGLFLGDFAIVLCSVLLMCLF